MKTGSTPLDRPRGVTWRAVLIAAALIPLNAYWIMDSAGQSYPTTVSLFFNVIFCITLLILVNLGVAHLYPRGALTQGELLTIYAMLSLASGIAGHDFLRVLIPMIPHAFQFATPENEWADLFHGLVPDAIALKNRDVLTELYRGESTVYTMARLRSLLPSTLAWTGFMFALVTVMLTINLFVRKQWTENEKLSYPIIQLPLEMTGGGGVTGVLRQPLLWVGFALAGAMDIINGFHFLYPAVPSLGGRLYDLLPLFTSKPWNAVGWTPIGLFPFAVGMAFFMPLDLSFSCWFFFLFWKAERVAAAAMGLRNLPGFPYVDEQSLGAYIGLCLVAVVATRSHLRTVGRRIIGRGNRQDDVDEPFSYRVTLAICLLAGAYLFGFSRYAGMSVWVIGAFFATYYAIALAVTRMRAELGSPVHDLHFIGPDEMMPRVFGTRLLGPRNLTVFAYYFSFNRAHRGHPMPHQLEGLKLADRARIDTRRLVLAMLFAMLFGIVSTFWAYYDISFREGARQWFANQPFTRLQGLLVSPRPPDYGSSLAMLFGFGQVLVLTAMRMRFVWWPFHAAGFAISSSWSMNVFWFSILVSSAAKWVLLRQGGLASHRRATPFFLGLIMGEFIVGSVWSLIGCSLNRPMYQFLY
ncbi:hypothetical protein FJZ36_11860 [Candidatus Poribacteria bacterium]|nr:hypothetical protein [Candidatus Poribacteria bacterium]